MIWYGLLYSSSLAEVDPNPSSINYLVITWIFIWDFNLTYIISVPSIGDHMEIVLGILLLYYLVMGLHVLLFDNILIEIFITTARFS
jgi:hypothetical protein